MYLTKMSEGGKTDVTDIGGLEWDHVKSRYSLYADPPDDSSRIPLLVSESPPALSNVKTMFGHPVSKANAKHLGASTQFYSTNADLQIQLKAALYNLNPAAEETGAYSTARMHQLCSNPVGGILLMLKYWNEEMASFDEPVLQVIANPAVASLGKFSTSSVPPGINLGEVWDLLTTSPFDQMPVANTMCPLMASSGGFSREVKPPTIANYLLSTAPIFIPSGEVVASTVSIFPRHPLVRAFFLPPDVCAPLIGWYFLEPSRFIPRHYDQVYQGLVRHHC
jgi:hypothetical protein